jgi:hypothetical protein
MEEDDNEFHDAGCALAERALALAFKTAAEGPHGLHTQAYFDRTGTSVSHVLAHLPAQHLPAQHLRISFEDQEPLSAALVPALAGLTGLTRLFIGR